MNNLTPIAEIIEELRFVSEEMVALEPPVAEGGAEASAESFLVPVTVEYPPEVDGLVADVQETYGFETISATTLSLAPGTAVKDVILAKAKTAEFAVQTVKECRKVLGHKVCVNVPVPVKRRCTKELIGGFEYPTSIVGEDVNEVVKVAQRCAREAAVEAGLLSLVLQNPAVFFGAFSTAFTLCMREHYNNTVVKKFRPRLYTRSSCGAWHRV